MVGSKVTEAREGPRASLAATRRRGLLTLEDAHVTRKARKTLPTTLAGQSHATRALWLARLSKRGGGKAQLLDASRLLRGLSSQ